MRAKVVIFGLFLLTILGCGGGALTTRGIAQLRAISAVTDPTSIDAFTDFNIVGTSLEVADATGYSNQTANLLTLSIRQTGTTNTLASATLNAGVDEKYTMFPYQTGASTVGILVAGDNTSAPAAAKCKVRFVHVDRLVGNVDVYYVDPDADLTEEDPVFINIPYQGGSGYIELDAGLQKEIIVTNAGTTNQVGNLISLTIPSLGVRTLLFLESSGPKLNIYTDTP